MNFFDSLSSGDVVAIVVAVISLIGVLRMAQANVKNTKLSASDKIAIGYSELLDDVREERKKDRDEIAALKETIEKYSKAFDEYKTEIDALKAWQDDVNEFIVPFIEGSKKNEEQLINAGLVPVYKLPPLPEWLRKY